MFLCPFLKEDCKKDECAIWTNDTCPFTFLKYIAYFKHLNPIPNPDDPIPSEDPPSGPVRGGK